MNEFDAAVAASSQPDAAQSARVGFSVAADTNPDAYAEAQRVARRTGVPIDTVFAQPDEMKKQSAMGEINFDNLARTSPVTAVLLANVDKAKIAHDDVGNLTGVEDLLYSLGKFEVGTGRAIASAVPKFNEGMWGIARAGAETFIPEVLGRKPIADYFARMGGVSRATADSLMPKAEGLIESSWYSGMQSLGLNAILLPAALASGGSMMPMLAGMGASTGGSAYGEARDKSVPVPQALAFGASQGVIEAGTEMIGMPALFSLLKPGGFLKKAGGYMIKEQGGEQIATHLQDLNEWATLNPEKTIGDYLKARPGAAVQTALATAFGGGGQVALMKGVEIVATRNDIKVETANQTADLLAKINETAAASKVLARDAETFEQHVKAVADNGPAPDAVFISAQTLQQSGLAEQVAALSPTVAEQFQAALDTGGDVRIPIGEYAANIAPTTIAPELVDHLKFDPEGFTRAEAQTYMQEKAPALQAEVDRVLGEQSADEAWKASAQEVEDAVFGELQKAGRFTESVNRTDALLHKAFASVMAAKLGMTPMEFFKAHTLRVIAERANGAQFDQATRQTPEDLLAQFNEADTINIKAPQQSEQEINDAEAKFLSDAPAGNRYPRSTRLLKRIRATSEAITTQLDGQAERTREVDSPLGHFSGYRVTADILAPDEFYNPGGTLKIKIYGKEQIEAGLLAEPALTFTVMPDGELSVNGPTLDEPIFQEFQKRGWAEKAKAGGQETAGWTALTAATGGNLPIQQVMPLLADVHARVREWRGEDYAGLYWSRATGALGALGDYGTAIFFQDKGGTRGSFNPATNTIALLKNADLSTFLHESGHFFLEVQTDLANTLAQDAEIHGADLLSAGEQQILDDHNALLAWFGVKGLTEWNNLSFEEKRAYHEQFARGFESYLFEGKAPSIELHGVFQRFRAWLLNVYRDLKNLNVELNDEVRGVFDRMLATTEQIQLAEQGRSMVPLFERADQAGMTPEDFATYQSLGVDATNRAIEELQARGLRDMQWLHNARGRMIKKLQKESDARRAEVRMDAKREIMSQPIYQAWEYLTGRDKDTAESVVEFDGIRQMAHGRLDRASVEAMDLPPEVAARLDALRMVKRDALHPDLVAGMFGFSSGDELLRTLATADKPNDAIEGLTDQRMLEQYGDLSSQREIEKAADAAIHNDARARMVATEANAIAKATGKPKILASAAKEFASAMVARLKVRAIKPGQYANAEVRASRAAAKASQAGDIETAGAEKRNQLINNYATRAAYDAQDEVEKALRYLKKFDGANKGLDAEYVEQIDALLSRFDLRQKSNVRVDKMTALAAWVDAQRDQGLEPEIPADLLNEAFRKSYKDLTVEEFRGVVDTVKQIEHLGRLKHKLLTAKDNRAYEAVRDEIVESIARHGQDREANTRTPTTNMGRAVQGLKRFWASHIKAATWARVMDGGKDGGPMWEYFVRVANERGDVETTMRAEATAALSKIMAPVFALGKMGGSGQFFPSIRRSLNREARIALALNVGNEGNLQRLLGGEGWTEAQILPVLQSLTPVEKAAVQAVWDHFETYRPAIAAKQKRIYGKEPDWVTPGSAISAALGLRGGYYPIKYDPAASQRAEEHADAEGAKRQLQGAYTTATTRRSFTKSRAEEVQGRPLLYTLSGLYSGVNDVIHDLAWHEWLIDTNRLLRSKTIDGAIRSIYGPEVKQQFKTWSQDIAEGDKGSDAAVDQALSRLRQGVSISGLGFNVMSAAMQPLGLTQSIVRVGLPWIGRGIAKYLAHPLEATRETNDKSSFMENRARTRFRELNELRNKVQGETPIKEAIGQYAYALMMRCQQIVDVPTWHGAYEKAIAEGNDEERAISLADQAVIDAQGGGQTKDLSAMERGGPAQKLFTVFYSFMNTALNLGVAQTMVADTPSKKAKLASDYLMLYIVPPVLGYFLKNALTPGDSGDDDPEKLARKLAANQIDYLMGLMVVVREFSEAGKTIAGANDFGRDYTGPAGLRLVTDAGTATKQIHQGEFDDALRKALVNVAGSALGLPSAQINRTITGVKALADGETSNPLAPVFGFQKKR